MASAAETTTSLDQVVSDIHILDIVEIFEHQNVKDVCKHLGLDTTDINNAKSVPYTSKKHAEDMLHLWYSRNGKDATIGTFIEAAEKVPKAKASLDKCKSRWNIDGPPKHRKRKRKRTEETIPDDPQTSQDTVMAVGSEEPVDEILAESQNDPTPQIAAAPQTLTNITNVVDNGQISSSHPQPMEAGTSMGGKENLKAGHVGVNSDTGIKEEKPCHIPPRVEVGEEIPGLPKGEDAISHMEYNKLIFDIIVHLEDDERLYREVKYLCRSGLGTSHGIPYTLLKESKPETFIDVLCQCQLLSPYDMDFLYHLMTKCKQTDFIKRIDDYCKFHEDDRLEIHKPNGTIAEGKVIVEVALNGHINQRSNRDTDRYKETFKRRLGIPKSAANRVGVGIGCVVLVFQLPLRWPGELPGGIGDIDVLARLTDDVSQRADWLMDSDVIGIHIEGQEYVDLTGVPPIELHDITEELLLSSLDDDNERDVCDDHGDDDIQESFTDKQTTIPNDPKLLEDSSVLSTVESTYLKAKPEQQQTTQNITEASSVKAKPGQQQQQHTQNITEGSSVKDLSEKPSEESIIGKLLGYLHQIYINFPYKIPLDPGDNKTIINLNYIDNLSIRLSLPKPRQPIQILPASYEEIFTQKSNDKGDGDDDILVHESSTDKQTTIPNEQKIMEDSSVLSTVDSTYLKAEPEQQQQIQNIMEASSVKGDGDDDIQESSTDTQITIPIEQKMLEDSSVLSTVDSTYLKVVSDIHILDIIDIFEHQNIEDVCKHLGLDTTVIKNVPFVPYSSKKHAKDMLHLWYSRNGKDATIATFIKAAEKVPNAKGSLDILKRKWNIDMPEKPPEDSILEKCQKYLRQYYINSLCKIPLVPGDNKTLINLNDIYINLIINQSLPTTGKPLKIPLGSYKDMFTRKSDEGALYDRLLVSAPAGSGKSIIAAKIAYDWATNEEGSPVKDVPLLFVLNMRGLDHTSNLEDAILSSGMIPKDSEITAKQLQSTIRNLDKNVIIILDAVDESDTELYNHVNSGRIVELLTGKILVNCRLVVMTRPWRITEITSKWKTFMHFEIQEFRKEDVEIYINRFFKESDESLGVSLIEYMNQNEMIASISSVPLMTLLVCIYWRESQGIGGLPNRISHLYDAIINIMYQNKLGERSTKDDDTIQNLKRQLGKMALKGMWPPENRIVFSADEASDSELVEKSCQIGYLSKQKSPPSILRTRMQASLTFFHKTFGEKCAGEYLASLADENLEELLSQLQSLNSVQDALSVQLILQFASGANVKAAFHTLQKLMEIFKQELLTDISKYYTEDLDLDDTLKIQYFIELCLACNYEADAKSKFTKLITDLFPEGTVYFWGTSALASEALGYYMPYAQAGQIKSLNFRATSNLTNPIYLPKPLQKRFEEYLLAVSKIPLSEVRGILELSDHELESSSITSPHMTLANKALLQDCWGSRNVVGSNIGPLIRRLKYLQLEILDISGYKLGDKVDVLIDVIKDGHMKHLSQLCVGGISMNGHQMERLARAIRKMPCLRWIDTSGNTAGESLPIMAHSLSSLKSVQILQINHMQATVQSMGEFAHKLPGFASLLVQLSIYGNGMDDTVAKHLVSNLPMASMLKCLSISVDGISKRYHNQLLSSMHHLSHLESLLINNSQYPDDMMMNAANVMGSLPHLCVLTMSAHRDTPPQVNSTTWQHFKDKLHFASSMKYLRLYHISLETDDFYDLVDLCRKKGYYQLRYSADCLPEGVTVPQDDIFTLW